MGYDPETGEEWAAFSGHTTDECEHEPGDHDWTGCTIDGCPCEGAWEE